MVLIDTNVAIALWVESDRTDAARRLLERDADWRTEAFALIEFANVMATYVRRELAAEAEALQRLKEPNLLEQIAYRDTWGRGTDSFISMIYERLILMRDLLADDGSIYVHCDWHISFFLTYLT